MPLLETTVPALNVVWFLLIAVLWIGFFLGIIIKIFFGRAKPLTVFRYLYINRTCNS